MFLELWLLDMNIRFAWGEMLPAGIPSARELHDSDTSSPWLTPSWVCPRCVVFVCAAEQGQSYRHLRNDMLPLEIVVLGEQHYRTHGRSFRRSQGS